MIAFLDQPVKAGVIEPQLGQEHLLFLGIHVGDVRLHLRADRQHLRALGCGQLRHLLVVGVAGRLAAGEVVLAQIGGIDDRL